jgi:hypothetical protein
MNTINILPPSATMIGTKPSDVTSPGAATVIDLTTYNDGDVATPRANIENAVYGYLQALRALNRTRVTTSEIASALSVQEAVVISVISAMKVKGVKVAT